MRLSIKRKKYIYWLVSFVSLMIILLSIYYLLGGFDSVRIERIESGRYSVVGKWVKGSAVRKEESELFSELKQLRQSGTVEGELCLIDFQNDTLTNHEVVHFMGILLMSDVFKMPQGYEVFEIDAKSTYMAALSMHPLVMPNTGKAQALLEETAAKDSVILDPMTLEIYYEDNSVMVQMFGN